VATSIRRLAIWYFVGQHRSLLLFSGSARDFQPSRLE
jgi:hypothetical protein